jgi:hypothetical protein
VRSAALACPIVPPHRSHRSSSSWQTIAVSPLRESSPIRGLLLDAGGVLLPWIDSLDGVLDLLDARA